MEKTTIRFSRKDSTDFFKTLNKRVNTYFKENKYAGLNINHFISIASLLLIPIFAILVAFNDLAVFQTDLMGVVVALTFISATIGTIIIMIQVGWQAAKKILDKVFIGPCENFIEELPANYFDVIYCNDVLEHLVDPYTVLGTLRQKLTKNGVVISSIPNIRYHDAFKKIILQKKFEYEGHGIFDKTHMRFFTKSSIANMYRAQGYEILSHEGINRTRSLKPYLYNIPFFFTAMDMFYLQFATVAKRKD